MYTVKLEGGGASRTGGPVLGRAILIILTGTMRLA